MADALKMLEQARRHMLASEADLALEKMQAFQHLVLSGQAPKEHAEACSQALRAVLSLAAAAREGMTAARRQIEEIAALSRKLDTYDWQGNRVENPIGQNRDRRY